MRVAARRSFGLRRVTPSFLFLGPAPRRRVSSVEATHRLLQLIDRKQRMKKGEPMKTIFAMTILLAAVNSVACGSAPVDTEGSTAAGAQGAASEKPKAEEAVVESKATPELTRSCTPAQHDACVNENDGWPCNCRIWAGQPQCYNCQ
jgi:hypothetical protein